MPLPCTECTRRQTYLGLRTAAGVTGITTENCAIARDLGFDGVAVLGSVWRSPDPVAKCKEFLSICSRLAGPKERLKSLSDTEVSFRS